MTIDIRRNALQLLRPMRSTPCCALLCGNIRWPLRPLVRW